MTKAIRTAFTTLPITDEQQLVTPGEVTPLP
jgi:hypothetical protein